MAATDPVAVVALLNQLGAPPSLTMLIAGESLFNDGTSIGENKLQNCCGVELYILLQCSLSHVAHIFLYMSSPLQPVLTVVSRENAHPFVHRDILPKHDFRQCSSWNSVGADFRVLAKQEYAEDIA